MRFVQPLPPIVLASASPRRAALLRDAGVSVQVRPADCDETPLPEEAALPYARRIAQAKLRSALPERGGGPRILAADTVVWLEADPTPLGKPADASDCRRMLGSLGGPDGHRVTTAWALGTGPDDVEVHHETTSVWFRSLSEGELAAYLAGEGWRDKAGGYGIQAEAAGWVARLEGSYTNVVGLPLAQVLARLEASSR